MSTKKTTKSSSVNSLPDWLTNPYQQNVASASTAAAQPAIGAGTQSTLDKITGDVNSNTGTLNSAAGTLSGIASGNFGANSSALTGAANGSYLTGNPWTATGNPITTSTALNSWANGGGLDTSYIDASGLNKTAAGDYLTADSNPYIKGVADQGADAAQARINAQFGAAGRSNGSGLYADLFGKGIADAANTVYANNYTNERSLQQQAQDTLLSTQQAAREAANSRAYGAAGSIFGAQNSAQENAASRAATAYDNERQRQQSAAGGLLNTQLAASSQLPSIFQSLLSGDSAALAAGQYADSAALNQQAKYAGILSQLAPAFQQNNTKTTEKTSGLGSTLGSIAQLAGAAGSLFGAPIGLSGALSGITGAVNALPSNPLASWAPSLASLPSGGG